MVVTWLDSLQYESSVVQKWKSNSDEGLQLRGKHKEPEPTVTPVQVSCQKDKHQNGTQGITCCAEERRRKNSMSGSDNKASMAAEH